MGGEDTTVEAEYDLMKSRGHDVQLLLFDNASIAGGALNRLKAGANSIYNRVSAKRLREAVQTFQPDIIHVHNFYFDASPSVIIEANKLNIPVVVTIQNFRLICANSLLLRNNKVCELCVSHKFPWYGVKYKCYHNSAVYSALVGSISSTHNLLGTWKKKVNHYITPAEFTKNKLSHSALDLPPEKISVKRNFIPDPGRAEGGRDNYYLFVGRISAEKGVNVLLEAWQQLPGRTLLIAGDGPELQSLQSTFGSTEFVRFLGRKDRPDILSLMKKCRALIFPSVWYEGLPLTIVEAFATGTPVIASSIGAMKEMIVHEKNGMLFHAGDSDDIARQIHAFESMPAGNFSKEARDHYLRIYHPDIAYLDVMNIYEKTINLAGRRK